MTINDAKDLIRDTVRIYLAKDKYGEYLIPYMKQRPVYMVGAPGIGKTAIIEQVAREFNIPVVSFSMTHLTIDNAIGVPVIRKIPFGDHYYDVAEYTVSEIIASVYHVVFDSKKTEGILFLDEINCVSDTLAPLMLLFLQYKKFGNKQLPPGWVIITAGNPPEYNKSVQEFDLATMDRLKYILVEPDVNVWMVYARKHDIHGAISAFLESHKDMFYSAKQTDFGQEYVTARGWEDLSKTLQLYELEQIPVTLVLIRQYITDQTISEEFFQYYSTYIEYKDKKYYEKMLSGTIPEQDTILFRDYGERLAIINQSLAIIAAELIDRVRLTELKSQLTNIVNTLSQNYNNYRRINLQGCFEQTKGNIEQIIKQEEAGNTLSLEAKHIYLDVLEAVTYWDNNYSDTINNEPRQLLYLISVDASERTKKLNGLDEKIRSEIEHTRNMIDANWGEKELEFYQSGLRQLKYIDGMI